MKFKTKYETIGRTIFQPKSEKPSLTDESFKQECDIDFIISNYVQRGIEPPVHSVDYGKQYTSEDFLKSMDMVSEVKSAFETLPAIEKERFNNSVTNYLDFISDPKNLRESYEKGYINRDTVDVSDVYPERYKKEDLFKENVTSTPSNPGVNFATNSNDVTLPTVNEGLKTPPSVPSSPTQTI